MSKTRTPVQPRSIDKKNRIVEAGYVLMARDGYYNTTTYNIATEAGVSTGILYSYFENKREILLEVLNVYVAKVFSPYLSVIEKATVSSDVKTVFSEIIDAAVASQKENAAMRTSLDFMTFSDKEINDKIKSLEQEMALKIVSRLIEIGCSPVGLEEKVHFAIRNIQDFARESYDQYDHISYETMKNLILRVLQSIFSQVES